MRVQTHVGPVSRAEFCREYLRRRSRIVKRETARRAERAEASRLAHVALLQVGVRS